MFLKEHNKEVYIDIRAAYIDTMNKVKSPLNNSQM